MEGAKQPNYVFLTIAALNMIISLYYYLRIVRLLFSAPDAAGQEIQLVRSVRFGLVICCAGIVLTGIISWIYDHILSLV